MALWKDHERRIAKRLGASRVPVADKRSTTDVISDWLSVECKQSKTPIARVEKALNQAEKAANNEQLPLAVFHTTGQRSDNDLVVMRLKDFEAYFGKG